MSFRTMKLELTGFVPELNAIQLGLRLNHSYKHLFELHPWSFKKKEVNFATVGVYTTGTINVTQGNTAVSGNATAWTAAMNGRFLKTSTTTPFYEISAVTAPGALTLTQNYTDSSATLQPYSIFQHRYSLPTDCDDVIAIIYDSSLPERTKSFIDNLDPERVSTGQPQWWCKFDNNTIELWPVPDMVYTMRVSYNISLTPLSAEADTPLFNEWLIITHARLTSYQQLATTEGGAPRYAQAIETARADFAEIWQSTTEEDMRKLSLPTKVIEDGIDFPQSNDYWMKHDPTDPRGSWR